MPNSNYHPSFYYRPPSDREQLSECRELLRAQSAENARLCAQVQTYATRAEELGKQSADQAATILAQNRALNLATVERNAWRRKAEAGESAAQLHAKIAEQCREIEALSSLHSGAIRERNALRAILANVGALATTAAA